MYTIHTTCGFIVGSKPHGEAGKILFIFTRDFGLIATIAAGIRLEKSKLRYNVQDYSLGIFSLVKGKEFWRLTSSDQQDVEVVANIEKAKSDDQIEAANHAGGTNSVTFRNKQLIARLALLLRRFLQGETAQPELFDCLKLGIEFLEKCDEISAEQLKTLESVIVFRILGFLGYIGKDSLLREELRSADYSISLLDELAAKRLMINEHINKALRESHL